jgi:predicted secreted protein
MITESPPDSAVYIFVWFGFLFVLLEFELRVSCLLGRHSTM